MNDDLSDSVFQSIVDTIASGWTVQAALDDHMVSRYDYDKARRKDPLKSEAHVRARADGADSMADDIPHIADTVLDPQRARNMIDARKWVTGVIKPRVYGPRMELAVTDALNPAALHNEGMRRARLMRDLPPALGVQSIEDAQLIEHSATDALSVAPSIFD